MSSADKEKTDGSVAKPLTSTGIIMSGCSDLIFEDCYVMGSDVGINMSESNRNKFVSTTIVAGAQIQDILSQIEKRLHRSHDANSDLTFLYEEIERMKNTQTKSEFLSSYERFMELASSHVAVLTPLLAMLESFARSLG